jgi:hypothetical protein
MSTTHFQLLRMQDHVFAYTVIAMALQQMIKPADKLIWEEVTVQIFHLRKY